MDFCDESPGEGTAPQPGKMGNLMQPTASPAPKIPGIDTGRKRPRFSVMLPTYEPDEKLHLALRSVLAQALPEDQMQIAVVDDGSRGVDVAEFVRAVDPAGRIEIYKDDPTIGISGNWNRAITLARGHLVHLLHQDDYLLPGFYSRMIKGFLQAPLIGMAFCRSRIVDEQGLTIKTNSRQRWWPGVLSNWLPKIATRQRIQTPTVVVARSTYETIGGYRTDLRQTLDWEMWVRIAARYAVWYDPRPLAAFRRHRRSESSRLLAEGTVWPDIAHAIRINAECFTGSERQPIVNRSALWYANSALREAGKQLLRNEPANARATIQHARQLFNMISDKQQLITVECRAVSLERKLESLSAAA